MAIGKTGKFGEFKEAIALALDVLWRNPLRSFLTVLGIVIGVTTIIVIGAVINGLNSNVLGNISIAWFDHYYRIQDLVGHVRTSADGSATAQGHQTGMG